MEISKNSWHYKLLEKWVSLNAFWDVPRNLCPYVQLLFFVLLVCLLVAVGIVGAVLDVYYFTELFAEDREVWAAVVESIRNEYGFFASVLFASACMLGAGVWIIVTIASLMGAANIIVRIQEARKKRYEATLPKDSWGDPIYPRKNNIVIEEPNIFWEWLKARHKKICPIITFKD